MKRLTKKDILDIDDLKTEDVDIPEWNGTVKVRTLTGIERDELEAAVVQPGGKRNLDNLRAKMVALSVVDDEGKRMFSFDEAIKLGHKSARALDRLFSVAQRLSGFSKQDVDGLTKDLSEGQSEDSTSA